MKKLSDKGLRQAESYILSSARVLERRRFEYLFGSGRAEDVVTALLPYRNPDGGLVTIVDPGQSTADSGEVHFVPLWTVGTNHVYCGG